MINLRRCYNSVLFPGRSGMIAMWEEECVIVLHDSAFNMEFLAKR
jgi:hypothetical protein